MVKCPKCECDDYEIIYMEEWDYFGDSATCYAEAQCNKCGEKFWVREHFIFDDAENWN